MFLLTSYGQWLRPPSVYAHGRDRVFILSHGEEIYNPLVLFCHSHGKGMRNTFENHSVVSLKLKLVPHSLLSPTLHGSKVPKDRLD